MPAPVSCLVSVTLGAPPAVALISASGLAALDLRDHRGPVGAVDRQVLLAEHLAALLLDVLAREIEHAASEGVVAADQEEGLRVLALREVVDDRRHLLVGHPGVDVHRAVAGAAFVERCVDEGTLALLTIGSACIARSAGFHGDDGVTFFWNTSVSNAFWAPTAPDASSAISSSTLRPRMPPVALISSTASCEDWTTAGATTLLAPERPTAMPILMGSAA